MALNNLYGYTFYFQYKDDVIELPITPPELSIKVGSNNEKVSLINGGDINILKSPTLTEVEFEARFPMRQYPYGRQFVDFQYYFDFFKDLKENKKMFRFIVYRLGDWDTNLLMALEEMNFKEDHDEGDDVIIEFSLRQAKEYGVKTLTSDKPTSTSTASGDKRDTTNAPNTRDTEYAIKDTDTLVALAKKYYQDEKMADALYIHNRLAIEQAAIEHGRASSSNGTYLYPGTKIMIPTDIKYEDLAYFDLDDYSNYAYY